MFTLPHLHALTPNDSVHLKVSTMFSVCTVFTHDYGLLGLFK